MERTAAPVLPIAEARGATGLAAIKAPKVICPTPDELRELLRDQLLAQPRGQRTGGDQRLCSLSPVANNPMEAGRAGRYRSDCHCSRLTGDAVVLLRLPRSPARDA